MGMGNRGRASYQENKSWQTSILLNKYGLFTKHPKKCRTKISIEQEIQIIDFGLFQGLKIHVWIQLLYWIFYKSHLICFKNWDWEISSTPSLIHNVQCTYVNKTAKYALYAGCTSPQRAGINCNWKLMSPAAVLTMHV